MTVSLLARRLRSNASKSAPVPAAAVPKILYQRDSRCSVNPNEKTLHWANFVQWRALVDQKLSSETLPKGPIFLGNRSPFEHNRDFKYVRPLDDVTRDSIYNLYLNDPVYWTPRRLSHRWKVSMARARAIIHIKNYEANLTAKGFQPNMAFVAHMEEITNAQHFLYNDTEKKKVYTGKPLFVTLPEGASLTRPMAAELLKLSAKVNKDAWADAPIFPPGFISADASYRQNAPPPPVAIKPSSEGLLPEPCVIYDPCILPEGVTQSFDDLFLEKNVLLSGKHSLVFTDTSKRLSPEDRPILIRETDGTLRRASHNERLAEAVRVYGNLAGRNFRRFLFSRSTGKTPVTIKPSFSKA